MNAFNSFSSPFPCFSFVGAHHENTNRSCAFICVCDAYKEILKASINTLLFEDIATAATDDLCALSGSLYFHQGSLLNLTMVSDFCV